MDQEWQFRCGKCGFKKLLVETGKGMRIGAGNTRVLGWCPDCRWFRLLHLENVERSTPDSTDKK